MQMPDVIWHQIVERDGCRSGERLPPDLVQVVARMPFRADVLVAGAHHARKMAVIAAPQAEQLVPRGVVVRLRADPVVLRVATEDVVRLTLGANESLVIVGRGVDEMSDDLLDRPDRGRGAPRDDALGAHREGEPG